MPGAGLFPWLRELGNSRKCHSPRVPGAGGRGAAGPGLRTAQRGLTAACSLTRAQRLTGPSPPASGTPHSSSQGPLASRTPYLLQEPLIPRLRNHSPRFSPQEELSWCRGMGRSGCPLTLAQLRDLPAAAVPCQPRKEGKVSVMGANAVARPLPLPKPSHLRAITFQQVGLLH